MIDVNAVREGTRWSFRGREVTVEAVTGQWVIFYAPDGIAEVEAMDSFCREASDPAMGEYHSLLDKLTKGSTSGATVVDALVYLFRRLGPPAPLNVAPPPAPAKPEPVTPPADPIPDVEDCVASTLADECVVEAEPKLNRFKQPRGDRSTNRWV